jgi:hypothetical protein
MHQQPAERLGIEPREGDGAESSHKYDFYVPQRYRYIVQLKENDGFKRKSSEVWRPLVAHKN